MYNERWTAVVRERCTLHQGLCTAVSECKCYYEALLEKHSGIGS